VIHSKTALRAGVYLAGDNPLIGWGFERRVRLQVGRAGIWVAPIAYVILRKLEYYEQSGSDRHLRDVAMILGSVAILRIRTPCWSGPSASTW
jgi:hypothetical protein